MAAETNIPVSGGSDSLPPFIVAVTSYSFVKFTVNFYCMKIVVENHSLKIEFKET